VNQAGSGDMYPKGANMLHTIRTILNDDVKWRSVLRGLNETFYHQTVTTEQIETFLIDQTGLDLKPVFDQYLRDVRIPVLDVAWVDDESGSRGVSDDSGSTLRFRWTDVIDDFRMPVEIETSGFKFELNPTTQWQSIHVKGKEGDVIINPNYYVYLDAP
jgi:aminopeptidase N